MKRNSYTARRSFLRQWGPSLGLAAVLCLEGTKPWKWLPEPVNPWYQYASWKAKKCDVPEAIGAVDDPDAIILKGPDNCKDIHIKLEKEFDVSLPLEQRVDLKPDWENKSIGVVQLGYDQGILQLQSAARQTSMEEFYVFLPDKNVGYILGTDETPGHYDLKDGELVTHSTGVRPNFFVLAQLMSKNKDIRLVHYHPSRDLPDDDLIKKARQEDCLDTDMDFMAFCDTLAVNRAGYSNIDIEKGLSLTAWMFYNCWPEGQFAFDIVSERGVTTVQLTEEGKHRLALEKKNPYQTEEDCKCHVLLPMEEFLFDAQGRRLSSEEVLYWGAHPLFDEDGNSLTVESRIKHHTEVLSNEYFMTTFRPL